MKTFLLFLFIFETSYAGTSIRGGGDDAGLDFQAHLQSALSYLQKNNPEIYKTISGKGLRSQPRVIVVDDALDVQFKDLIQNSVATNDPAKGEIYLNRQRWNAIKNDTLKDGISLHEDLSLKGLEQTGFYPISAQYVASRGGEARELKKQLKVNRIKQLTALSPGRSPYEVLKTFFEEASEPLSPNDIPKAKEIYQKKVKFICQSSNAEEPSNLGQRYLGRVSKITTAHADRVDRGPMFDPIPEQSEIREPRFYLAWRIEEMNGYSSGLYRGGSEYWWTLGVSKISVSKTEIKQSASFAPDVFQDSPQGRTYAATFRKNNGMITYHWKEAENKRIVVDEIGYCY